MARWETEAIRGRAERPRPGSGTIDLRDPAGRGRPSEVSAPAAAEEPPPGTLIVPLDAWQRMLDQLGNLHEAGQQLAETSARAARAETEAEFLRERVADLRRQLGEQAETEATDPIDQSGPAVDSREEDPARDESLVRFASGQARSIYRELRARRSRRRPA